MPSRNTRKTDAAESYYHVYARGANKQSIFVEPSDYTFFLNLFARYLSGKPVPSSGGADYPHFAGKVELLAYCLMANHFHLLFYQSKERAMPTLMQSLMTSYSGYFNRKYKRTGPLFESRYKASRIDAEPYLQHISRYIHLNPRYWQRYPYSSLAYYQEGSEPEWLVPFKVLALFDSRQDYVAFVADYQAQKRMLDEIKHQLADQ